MRKLALFGALGITTLALLAVAGCDGGSPTPTAPSTPTATTRATTPGTAPGTAVVGASPAPTAPAVSATPSPPIPSLTTRAYPYPVASPSPTVPPSPTPSSTPSPTPKPLNLADQPPMTIGDWPRPSGDNGRGMHFTIHPYYEEAELDRQIARLKYMNVKWCLVLYADENQLEKAATRFRDAGIYVVWRKSKRPYERIYGLKEDIHYLQSLGMPPYMQIYNEPTLGAEWEKDKVDIPVYLENFALAARDVYNAGGYVGLQLVNEKLLVETLRYLKQRGGEPIFHRMFFIPHPYALNHPPDYAQDVNGVLGFLPYARIFQEEIGFVPPMIAGEGGWKYHSDADGRYPQVDDQLHRDYYVELFNWFRTGTLSNGDPLPDYLLAFCPWLISDKLDDNAWYDSFAGDRTLTIEAVRVIPPFTRRFSWE
ncbi:MAG: hypothetical protein KKA73_02875 [Chloroflexi bacterium]|nr:hypothetical protein [Chloroflexota bacterium]MBU1746608.1 hypothetical protein [Chloroflexota bacterium]